MQHAAETEAGRLLRLLLLWNRTVPAYSGGRCVLCSRVASPRSSAWVLEYGTSCALCGEPDNSDIRRIQNSADRL
jgi:hypothetical protein